MAMARARSFAGKLALMMDKVAGIISAAPIPVKARVRMSMQVLLIRNPYFLFPAIVFILYAVVLQ